MKDLAEWIDRYKFAVWHPGDHCMPCPQCGEREVCEACRESIRRCALSVRVPEQVAML